MLRQIEWQLKNRPITKSGVFPVITSFFWIFFFSVLEPLKKSGFDVPATQVFLFAFFVSSGV